MPGAILSAVLRRRSWRRAWSCNGQIQQGEIRLRGIELEAKTSITRSVDVVASYAYIDMEVTQSNDGTVGKTLMQTTGDWRLALNVSNLFDKEYVATCGYFGDGCKYGYRRSGAATLTYRW